MTTYTTLPTGDENLNVTVTESDDLVTLNITPAAVSVTGAVSSVNGLNGAVVLDTDDIQEGTTNLYYTDARADARAQLKIDALIDGAPGTLDTLNEIAAALNDDPNAYTTLEALTTANANAIQLKANSADLATVATSGDYDDLSNKPTLFSGDYNDLTNTPTIPTNNNQLTNGAGYITDYTVVEADVTAHQAALSITESQISDLSHYDDFDTDFAAKGAADLSYDPTDAPNLTQTNVKAALDHLDSNKVETTAMGTSVVQYYTDAASGITGYTLSVDSLLDAEFDTTAVNIDTGTFSADDTELFVVASEAGTIIGNPGHVTAHAIVNARRTSGIFTSSAFYFKVFHRTSAGVETLMGTSGNTLPLTNTDYTELVDDALLSTPEEFTATDRIVIKWYSTDVTGTAQYDFQFGGSSPSRTNFPVPVNLVVQDQDASEVETNTANFSNNLSSSDTTVQAALDTLDNISLFSGDYDDLTNKPTIPTQYTDTDAVDAVEAVDSLQNTADGFKIGDGEFSVTGNTPDNSNGDYEINGVIIEPTGNSWPMVQLFSTGESAGSNPIYDRTSNTDFQQFPNAVVQFGAANGAVDSESALETGKRVGSLAWLVHDGNKYGGNSVRASADLTVTSIEDAASDNDRAVKMTMAFMPESGDGTTTSRTTVFTAQESEVVVTPAGTEVAKFTDTNVELHGLVYPDTDGTDGQVLTTDGNGNLAFETVSGGGGSSTLGGLSDVNITSVADNDLLIYNGTAAEWQNTNLGVSVTPTLATLANANASNSYTFTVSNHSTYDDPAYKVELKDGSTVVVANSAVTDNEDGTFTFTAPATAKTYTLEVTVQDFGDLKSEVASGSLVVQAFGGNFRYWRFAVEGTTDHSMIANIELYTGTGQTGTNYPPDMTSNTAPSGYTASTQYTQSGYDPYKAFNSNTTGVFDAWWSLAYPSGQRDGAWIQIDLGQARDIKSFQFLVNGSYFNTSQSIAIYGSDTGSFSGEETTIGSVAYTGSNSMTIG